MCDLGNLELIEVTEVLSPEAQSLVAKLKELHKFILSLGDPRKMFWSPYAEWVRREIVTVTTWGLSYRLLCVQKGHPRQ